jgi:hypothetical protein
MSTCAKRKSPPPVRILACALSWPRVIQHLLHQERTSRRKKLCLTAHPQCLLDCNDAAQQSTLPGGAFISHYDTPLASGTLMSHYDSPWTSGHSAADPVIHCRSWPTRRLIIIRQPCSPTAVKIAGEDLVTYTTNLGN